MDWTAFSALVALVLGLLSVWLGYLLPLHRSHQAARKAVVSVRYEVYQRPDTERMQDRLIVVHDGPHEARRVAVLSMMASNGEPVDFENGMVAEYLPAVVLQPGQEHPAILEWSLDDLRPDVVSVAWSDGRGRQQREYSIAPMYV